MAKLVLVRHGESAWNRKGLWTGWQDIPLSKKGKKEASLAASSITDLTIQLSYSSDLARCWQTLDIIKQELQIEHVPTIKHRALKERHYGVYTGKNKWEIQKMVGKTKFKSIRRGWNYPIKDGETLKDVYFRVVPYFQQSILPHLTAGKNVLLVAHGNSIRALVKHLEEISDEAISEIELATGEVIIYELDSYGKVINKERKIHEKKN